MKYFLLIDMGYDGIAIDTYNTKEEACKHLKEHIEQEITLIKIMSERHPTEPAIIIEGNIIENYNEFWLRESSNANL